MRNVSEHELIIVVRRRRGSKLLTYLHEYQTESIVDVDVDLCRINVILSYYMKMRRRRPEIAVTGTVVGWATATATFHLKTVFVNWKCEVSSVEPNSFVCKEELFEFGN